VCNSFHRSRKNLCRLRERRHRSIPPETHYRTFLRPGTPRQAHLEPSKETEKQLEEMKLPFRIKMAKEKKAHSRLRRVSQYLRKSSKQLECGNGIVALWNDHDDWELEFEFAMNDIRLESCNGIRELPATLLFSVFGSASLYVRRRQRFYAEPFKQLSEPYVTWIEGLKKL
jgi:hypothetical protein